MQIEKAQYLNDFLQIAIHFLQLSIERKENELPDHVKIKKTLIEETFQKMYEEFETELAENILEYKDKSIIREYLSTYIGTFTGWRGLGNAINGNIMKSNNEVSYLLKLKLIIDSYGYKLQVFTFDYYSPISDFDIFYTKVISDDAHVKYGLPKPEIDKDRPKYDERFDFDMMIAECRNISLDNFSQAQFIQDRLIDLKQWQIVKDKKLDWSDFDYDSNQDKYKYTREFYPNFEMLCELELERLDKKAELEKKKRTMEAIEKNPIILQNQTGSPYKWNANATDMLELITAFWQKEVIIRMDGQKATKTELISYLSDIFNLEIKDPEGMLSRATARKNSVTPFLDGLKIAFDTYAQVKDEKQKKRR